MIQKKSMILNGFYLFIFNFALFALSTTWCVADDHTKSSFCEILLKEGSSSTLEQLHVVEIVSTKNIQEYLSRVDKIFNELSVPRGLDCYGISPKDQRKVLMAPVYFTLLMAAMPFALIAGIPPHIPAKILFGGVPATAAYASIVGLGSIVRNHSRYKFDNSVRKAFRRFKRSIEELLSYPEYLEHAHLVSLDETITVNGETISLSFHFQRGSEPSIEISWQAARKR